jgi:hypothetical protein
MQQSSKPSKLESIIALILVGIFVYRRFFAQRGQKVDKDETRDQIKDFGKILKNFLCVIVNTFDEWFQTFLG